MRVCGPNFRNTWTDERQQPTALPRDVGAYGGRERQTGGEAAPHGHQALREVRVVGDVVKQALGAKGGPGHGNVSVTTDVYAHSLPGWQKQAAAAFARAMEE